MINLKTIETMYEKNETCLQPCLQQDPIDEFADSVFNDVQLKFNPFEKIQFLNVLRLRIIESNNSTIVEIQKELHEKAKYIEDLKSRTI